ncbi:MAG TPA: PKD domain-containing protein [Thermoplasmata archaeon]|nr:PKD domain-containing protein [Thermoplasmata archaeon]
MTVADSARIADTSSATFVVTPTLGLSSHSGSVGTRANAIGTGFPAFERISLEWPLIGSVCTTVSDRLGSLTCSFLVPSSPEGQHFLSYSGGAGSASASVRVGFTVTPSVVLSQATATVGESEIATGTGFPAFANVEIQWAAGGAACAGVASASGTFRCGFTVPTLSNGAHPIIAQILGGGSTISVGATVSVGPSASLSTQNAQVGDTISVSAEGLPANAAYSVLWDWATIACSSVTLKTTPTGSVECAITVPATVRGPHTLAIESNGVLAIPSGAVDVAPALALSSATAAVGAYVVLTGTGFWENSKVAVGWDTSSKSLCTTVTANGGFSCLFVVPAATAGSHQLNVRDLTTLAGSGGAPSISLLVTPSLTLAPGSGPAGTIIDLIGGGFAGSTPVQIAWDNSPILCSAGQTASTAADGSFVCPIVVPTGAVGPHSVTATDLASPPNTALATYWTTSAPSGGAAPARPLATCNSGCSISLSTSSGPVGTSVTVTGTSFAATASVAVTWSPNAVALCSATTSSGGGFSCSFLVPPAVQGTHTVTAADNAIPSNFNTATFTVSSQVTLSASSGVVGSSATASGSGFAASSSVTVTWSPGSITVCTATSNSSGSFSCTFQVPSDVQGVHTVTGTDGSSNSAAASFTVNPSLALSASSGPVGSTLTATGTGFAGSSTTTISFDAAAMTCTQGAITTHANGTFTCTFTVPSAVIGAHTVSATDHSSNTASATFTVVSTIQLSPTSGPVGTSVTVSGHGFAGGSLTAVTWSPGAASLCSATTSAAGDFSCSFTVPAAVAGSHTVTATDSSTNSAATMFSVTSAVSLSPTSGPVGSSSTITGTGFAASSSTTVTWSPSGAGTLCTATTGATGGFSCSFTVPTADQGAHSVTATDAASNTASAPFTVGPSESVSPTSGIVGSSATVSGNGYSTGASVTVTWSAASTISCTVGSVVSALGQWSCTFTVAHTAQGTYTITGTESSGSPSSATSSFTVEPALSISPTSGTEGTAYGWAATGFASGASITASITFAGPTTFSCTGSVASTGDFSCAVFSIPQTPAGTYTTTATDSASNTASATLKVLPSLTLGTTSGVVGTTAITATGFGFAAASAVTVSWAPGGATLCTATTNSFGSFSCSFTAPHAVAGSHTVTGTDSASPTANSATATFSILPEVSIVPTSGQVGTSVTATGTGFAGTASVTMSWKPSGTLCSATSNAVGDVSCSFTVPIAFQGGHSVTGSDGTNAASTIFTVEPTLTVSPTSGPVGTVVSVSGSGYGASASVTVSVSWTSITFVCTLSANSSGSFTPAACGSFFTVPATAAGTYTFHGTDSSVNASTASALFTVTSKITLAPTGGAVGTTVTVTGTGFAASSTVSMNWGGSQALTCTGGSSCSSAPQATFTSDSTGGFSATFLVPPSTAGGHLVRATDASSNTASATFVTSSSLVITAPGSAMGAVGSSVSVLGNGFASAAAVSVSFASVSAVTVCTGSTNLTGAFACSFTVPAGVFGAHAITATDAASNTASATFSIVANLTISPTSGIVGSSATVTGTGYAGASTITLTWDGSTTLSCTSGSLTTSSAGGFGCTFTVPAAFAGAHTVAATDASSHTASTSFTVVPHVVLSPTSGVVGSTFVAFMTGYGSSLLIFPSPDTWDGSTIVGGSASSPATGSYDLTFTVPPSVHGAHTLVAADGSGNSASATFTVDASLALAPSSGIVGSSATATGTGYAGSAAVTVTWSPGGATLCTASSSTVGSFTCTFTVPHAVTGAHTVTGTDASSNSATATFTVAPSLSLSPTGGIVGTSVVVTGAGFPSGASFSVTFSGGAVSCTPTGTVGAVGDWSCSITVPSAPIGANVVTGSAGAQTASATFTVAPSISLSVSVGPVATPVTASGHGYAGSSAVTVSWSPGGATLCTSTTNPTGDFSCSFVVPAAVNGAHTVTGTDAASDLATTSFTVTAKLVLSPTSGIVGSSTTASGTGFAGTSNVGLAWTAPNIGLACTSGSLVTGATGSFTCAFQVPPAVAGPHSVTATDASSNSASSTFTIVSSLALAPAVGVVGSTSTAIGNGFGGALVTSVTWAPGALALCSATTNATGFFSCSFTVPAAVHGGHLVTATDTSSNSATATYLVGSNLVLTPSAGIVGSSTTATGTGFIGSSSVTLTWSGPTTSLTCTSGSLSTSATGGFTCTFTVPSAPIGGHAVTAVDPATNTASAVFTVGPFIIVTPTSGEARGYGIAGTTVTVDGQGFTAGDTVTVTWTPGTLCSGTADALGTFSCSSVIPATPAAKYTLTGTDAHSNSATAGLTVVPTIIAQPDDLMVGGVIWVNGTGFFASQTVNVVWTPVGSSGSSICPSTSTLANGSFTCGTFTIPREAAGPVLITATDTGLQASFNYTVTTDLTVSLALTSPASEPPTDVGVTVTFTATAMLGFTPYASYAWSFGDGATATTASPTASHAYATASGPSGYTATVTVTDNVGSTATSSMTVVVNPDPTVTTPTASRTSADVGQSVTFSTIESGGTAGGLVFSWNGLPAGCSGTTTRTVTCASLGTAGTYSISATVTDGPYSTIGGSYTSSTLLFVVDADPTVSLSPSAASADVGQLVNFGAAAAGGSGGFTFAWSGLPTGCPIAPTTASITCTVSASGSFSVSVTVTDSNGGSGSSGATSFSVFSDPALASPSPSRASADVGQAVTFTDLPTSSGSGGLLWAWAGLPTGCSGSSGTVTCNPSAAGTYSITAQVTDSNGFVATSAPLSFTVFADPATSVVPSVASADIGQPVTFGSTTVGGSGGVTIAWTGLPAGCPASPATASVACASVTTSGTYLVSETVTDSNGMSASSNVVTFNVFPDPTVTVSASPVSADVGQTVVFTATAASGSGTYAFAWTGLPAGCPAAPASPDVSCTVTTPAASTVSATVTDSNAKSVTSSPLAFTVFSDPTVSASETRASADVGQLVSFTATAALGSGGFSYSWSGLPSGCSGSTATVSCVAPNSVTSSAAFVVSVHVIDSNGVGTSSGSVTLTVFADPTLSAAASRSSADVGQTVVFSAVSTLGSGSDTFSWSGLPATGCLGTATATVTCVPTVSGIGSYSVTASVADSDGFLVTSTSVALTVSADPTVTAPTGTVASADVGQGVAFASTTALGSGGDAWAWAGLPPGCNAGTSSTVNCPILDTAGAYSITATVTDSNGFAVTSSALAFTVFADPIPTTPVASAASADVGQAITFSSTVTLGSGGNTWSWSGLPTGCPAGTTASVVCPSVSTAGTFSVTAKVTDSNGRSATTTALGFTVYSDPTVSSLTANRASADVGQAVTFSATAALGTGSYPTFTWSGLPAGCPVVSTPSATCAVLTTAATSTVSVTVTDSNGFAAASGTLSFTVFADPTVTSPTTSAVSADVGQSISMTTSASLGSGGYTFSWSGLPSGCSVLSLVATVNCPSVSPPGTYLIKATATDSNGFAVTSASTSFTVFADPVPTTPTASAVAADVGQSVTFASTATLGSGGYVWSWSGLPTGCAAGATASTVCASVTASGTFSVVAKVTDSNGWSSTTGSLPFTVYADPKVTSFTTNRASADVGQSATFTAIAQLGSGTYPTFSWIGLPTGCPVATTSQIVCASVSTAGTYSVTVTVTDSVGGSATSSALSFRVFADPTASTPSASRASSDVGQVVTFATSAALGSGGYSYGWTGLPTGCPAFPTTGSISCTVTTAGTFTIVVSVTDSNGFTVSSNPLIYTVNADPLPTTPRASVGSADVGQPVTFSTSATLGSGGYTWAWSDLPAGCVASATASVTCAAVSTAGAVSVSATVTDSSGVSVTSGALAFTVYADPSVGVPSANRSSADIGQAIEFTATATSGSGGYVYTWSGLPSGCSGLGASIACRPTGSGTASVGVTATDSNGVSVSSPTLPYTVYTDPGAATPTASVASADVGQVVTFGENPSGGSGGDTFSWSGLPAGCPGSALGGGFSCTVSTAAVYSVTVTVTDSNRASATSAALSFTVFADPTVTVPVASAASADVGQSITFTVAAASGTGTYTYAWSGLPSGCAGAGSATATCTVTASLRIQATVTDTNGFSVTSGALSYTVFPDPTLSAPQANRSSADVGQLVTFSTVASGGSGGYVYSWLGLPGACPRAGASVSCAVSSSVQVSVTVTDSNGVAVTSPILAYTVYPDPAVTSPQANRSSLDAGQNVSFTSALSVPGAGGVTFTWQSSSAAFACGVSGTLSVSCRAAAPGSYSVTLTATDRNGGLGTSASLTVTALADPTAGAPTFSPRTVLDVATTVSGSVSASGGAGNFAYTWEGLPNGCTGAAASISCTPAASGGYTVWVWIVDGNGFGIASPRVALTVDPQLTAALSGNRQTSTVGLAVTLSANTTGGTGPFNYSWSFGDGTKQFGPTASHEYPNVGTYTVTCWVNDSGGSSIVRYWVVSVGPAPSVFGIPSPNVSQLELVAAFLVLAAAILGCLLIYRRRRRPSKSAPAAPAVQAWQAPPAAAPAPATAPPAKAGRAPRAPANAAPVSAKTNIDQTLAELEAMSEQDRAPNEP